MAPSLMSSAAASSLLLPFASINGVCPSRPRIFRSAPRAVRRPIISGEPGVAEACSDQERRPPEAISGIDFRASGEEERHQLRLLVVGRGVKWPHRGRV